MSQRDQLFDLACFMRALDLVITVDSMPAHLAGALGVPVWNLLHSDPDWRWMEECERSPWYPTMRLFRQRTIADWRGVIAHVTSELQRLTNSSQGQRIPLPANITL
jgi:ADP-heptose:LPS heptosyltransferase